jgi:hypothetical protein
MDLKLIFIGGTHSSEKNASQATVYGIDAFAGRNLQGKPSKLPKFDQTL